MEKEIYEIQITISNLNKEDYESLMVKTKELAAASKKEVKVANKNIVKSDVNGQLPLSEQAQRKLLSEYFAANPSDSYYFANVDEAYHKGIEIGIWALNREIESGNFH